MKNLIEKWKHRTITERLMAGAEFHIPSEMNMYIEQWHKNNLNMSLVEYLGIDDWMYNKFLTDPNYVYIWLENLRKE